MLHLNIVASVTEEEAWQLRSFADKYISYMVLHNIFICSCFFKRNG